jgi:hypothetical protein
MNRKVNPILYYSFFAIMGYVLFTKPWRSESNDKTPEETEQYEKKQQERENSYNNSEGSSTSSSVGSEYCSEHGEYVPSSYTNANGEVKTTGCTKCLYNDVNEELNEPGGFRDRVSNF